MKALPYTPESYQLLHDGTLAMSRIEEAGMCVDVDYLHKSIKETKKKIVEMQREIADSKVVREWRRVYRTKMNLKSTEQLGVVLFDKLGHKSVGLTPGGKPRTDMKALESVKEPFVQTYLEIKKYEKAVSTNLNGIFREAVDGAIHCFFNLHLVRSFRSSSQDFNFQNIPKRDKAIAKLIRRCFVARPGRMVVEIDFSGNEVKAAAAFHKDPTMIEYLNDPSSDMHRDLAQQLFLLPPEEMNVKTNPGAKDIRFYAKNQFTFAQFYGSAYFQCAPALWDILPKLSLADGTPLKQHLRSKGIRKLGECNPRYEPLPNTFEENVRKVERDMWDRRFPIYSQWKKDWYAAYQKRGWFTSLTGFVYQGYMRRNQVINYPVQGSAFHFLLKTLIQIVLKELPRRRMKSLIVGQVHDSIVADVVPEEYEEFVGMCHHIMTVMLPKFYPWINTPMAVEVEAAKPGGSWADIEKEDLSAVISDFETDD